MRSTTLRTRGAGGALGAWEDEEENEHKSVSPRSTVSVNNPLNGNSNTERASKLSTKISRHMREVKMKLCRLGRGDDTEEFRTGLVSQIGQIEELFGDLENVLEDIKADSTIRGIIRENILTGYDQTFKEFCETVASIEQKMKQYVPRPPKKPVEEDSYDSDDTGPDRERSRDLIQGGMVEMMEVGPQHKQVNARALFEYEIAKEREEDTQKIAHESKLLLEAKQDIARLVEEDGQNLTQVEVKVSEAKESVIKGNDHLQVARKHQKTQRRCWCIILIVVVSILGLVSIPTFVLVFKN